MSPQKKLFDSINARRVSEGKPRLTWAQFCEKREPKTGRRDLMLEDEKPRIKRPPAVYDNISVWDKYL